MKKKSLFKTLHESDVPFLVVRSTIKIGSFSAPMYSIITASEGKFSDDRMNVCYDPKGLMEYDMKDSEVESFKGLVKRYKKVHSEGPNCVYEKKGLNFKEYYSSLLPKENESKWAKYLKNMV